MNLLSEGGTLRGCAAPPSVAINRDVTQLATVHHDLRPDPNTLLIIATSRKDRDV